MLHQATFPTLALLPNFNPILNFSIPAKLATLTLLAKFTTKSFAAVTFLPNLPHFLHLLYLYIQYLLYLLHLLL